MAGYYSGSDPTGIKRHRNICLSESDQYMLDDHPTTKKDEWVIYRQALRDMDFSDLENLNWPEPPTEAREAQAEDSE